MADGVYHIYYTKLSDKQGWLCWGHVATRDWKEYQELPDCLLPDDRDVSLTTGSVLYHEGVYHAFYAACGTDGIYRIFSAVSRDGVLFEKNRESLLPEGRPGLPRGRHLAGSLRFLESGGELLLDGVLRPPPLSKFQ